MRAINLTPDNIRYFASYLHSSVDIQDRIFHFGAGSPNEKLLEVPLGEVTTQSTIVVTVYMDKSRSNTQDTDLQVGISDTTNTNIQTIVDIHNYHMYPPCYPNGASHDNRTVPTGTTVPSTFKLTFIPFYKYAACETAQEGGYINTGTFNAQIDTSKPLLLQVFRSDAAEQYFIHYLKIEVY